MKSVLIGALQYPIDVQVDTLESMTPCPSNQTVRINNTDLLFIYENIVYIFVAVRMRNNNGDDEQIYEICYDYKVCLCFYSLVFCLMHV